MDEHGRARPIALLLVLTGFHLRAPNHDPLVDVADVAFKLIRIAGRRAAQPGGGDRCEGALDVMSVGGTLRGYAPSKDDLLGLVDLEDGPLDPIGEISLEESEQVGGIAGRLACCEVPAGKLGAERLEQSQSLAVISEPSEARPRLGCTQIVVAGSQQRVDQTLQLGSLRLRAERGSDCAGFVAQLVQRLIASDARDAVEPLLQLLAAQGAPYARAFAGGLHVVQQDARRSGDSYLCELNVAFDRPRPAAWPQRQSWKLDRSWPCRCRAAVEEQRSVRGWSGEHGAAVDDYRLREIERGDVIPAAPHKLLGRLLEIGRIQAAREPPDLAARRRATRPARILRDEDLGEVRALSGAHGRSLVELGALKGGSWWNKPRLTCRWASWASSVCTTLAGSMAQATDVHPASPLPQAIAEDVQARVPPIPVALSRVGVTGVEKVIRIREELFYARLECYVDLGSAQKGAHMSRFEEVVNEAIGEVVLGEAPFRAETLAKHIAELVRERQGAERAEVTIAARYPEHKPAPVSGVPTQEIYTLFGRAVALPSGTRRLVGVSATGMTACPCAQELVAARARERLLAQDFSAGQIDQILDTVPVATHNQRGLATLQIGCTEQCATEIDATTLLEIAEASMSSEIYELMKRSDEVEVVEKAHRRPRFVEDCVREMLAGVARVFADLDGSSFVSARQENLETIHQHNVVAERHCLLSELRAEVAAGASPAHTTLDEWLPA